MDVNAVVIDFELANPVHASIVEMGACRITNGVIGPPWCQRVRPTPPHDSFGYGQVKVHGIRPVHVQDAPAFADVAPKFLRTLGDSVLIAHGALSSDLSMLNQSLTAAGIVMPTVRYLDTHHLARALVPGLERYGIAELSRELLGEEMVGHHNAGADCLTTARLMVELTRQPAFTRLEDYVKVRHPKYVVKPAWSGPSMGRPQSPTSPGNGLTGTGTM